MILTPSDLVRLKSLGYDPKNFSVLSEDNFYRLKNINGHCFFFDEETTSCKIYKHRPIGCRIYPIIIIPSLKIITVDNECPARYTVTMEDIIDKIPLIAKVLKELRINLNLNEIKVIL